MNEPAPLPYSPYRQTGNLVFLAGQIGWDPETRHVKPGIEDQTHQVMQNISAQLEKAGASFKDVVKMTVYLTDMGDFAKLNEVYGSYLSEPYPARTCIAVKELPRVGDMDLVVEIEAIAEIK